MKIESVEAMMGIGTEHATPAILVFDIETTPIHAYCWRTWKENIGAEQIERHSELLCFAAKWLGRPEMFYADRRDKRGRVAKDDKALVKPLHQLFDRADMVVAHNGQAFDVPTMRSRWVRWGMRPPSPYRMVDTCKLARSAFNFPHNSLQGLAGYLRLGHKAEHEGFKLWLRCMAGDADAWNRMERYNIQDVVLLEQVYLKLRPWDTKHPNVGLLHEDSEARCVVCGSKALKSGGVAHTGVSSFEVKRCRSCGANCRTGKRFAGNAQTMRNVN